MKTINAKSIKVAGFQKNSFIDFPGKIASVVFLGGCNFACHYCHNHNILDVMSNTILFSDVLDGLREQIGFIDGVVVTGGEPTMHNAIVQIIRAIKELGLLVKLDTNGTNYAILKELVETRLVDYVAMDIKAPLDKYKQIVGVDVDLAEIENSINYLKAQGKVDYMFRTTLSPLLSENDIRKIALLIHGAHTFQLQQFVPNDFSRRGKVVHLPYSEEDARKFGLLLSGHCEKFLLRGF